MSDEPTKHIILRLRLWPEEAATPMIHASLKRIEGPTRARGGCRSFALYRSCEGPPEIALVEDWTSPEALAAHVRSADFRVVLSAMDASTREPIFRLDTIGATEGFERVAKLLRAAAR